MTTRDEQFVELYRTHRLEHQRQYYQSRVKEYEAAHRQLITATAFLMALTGVNSVLAINEAFGLPALWNILAVALPVLSTAVASYEAVYAFGRQAKLFADAENALHRARARSPHLAPRPEQNERQALIAFVLAVESALQSEQGQWGQLASDIKPVEFQAAEQAAGRPAGNE